MAYNESEWSVWHSFSATAYLYNKSGSNWEQIASDNRVDIVVKHSTNHQFLRLSASAGGKLLLDTVVPPLSDWAKTSDYFAQLQLAGKVNSGPKENQNVDELYGFSFDQETLEKCNTKMMQAIAVLRKNSTASSAKTVNVTDWLAYLGMKRYADKFISGGFNTIDSILRIDESDLDDMAVLAGHKKIILAAVKKLKVHLDKGSAAAKPPAEKSSSPTSSSTSSKATRPKPKTLTRSSTDRSKPASRSAMTRTSSAPAMKAQESRPPPLPQKKKNNKKIDFANMTISKPVGVVRKMHISFDVRGGFKNVPKEWKDMGFHRQFGLTLAHCPKAKVAEYPVPIPATLIFLKSKWMEGEGPTQEGIFRLAPSKEECLQVRAALDRGESPATIKPHIAATLIKQWFRALPKGLLNATNQALIAQAAKNMCTIETVLERLPDLHRNTFLWCLDLLNEAEKHSKDNLMNRRNLSICMSPNLWKHALDADPMVALDFSSKVCEFVEKALEFRGKQLEAMAAKEAPAAPPAVHRETKPKAPPSGPAHDESDDDGGDDDYGDEEEDEYVGEAAAGSESESEDSEESESEESVPAPPPLPPKS